MDSVNIKFTLLISLSNFDNLNTFLFMCDSSCSRRYLSVLRWRWTETIRQCTNYFMVLWRVSNVTSFSIILGIRLAIFCCRWWWKFESKKSKVLMKLSGTTSSSLQSEVVDDVFNCKRLWLNKVVLG